MDSRIFGEKQKIADKVLNALAEEGVLVKMQPVNKCIEEDDNYFELLVPEAEVEEAHSILYELGY